MPRGTWAKATPVIKPRSMDFSTRAADQKRVLANRIAIMDLEGGSVGAFARMDFGGSDCKRGAEP